MSRAASKILEADLLFKNSLSAPQPHDSLNGPENAASESSASLDPLDHDATRQHIALTGSPKAACARLDHLRGGSTPRCEEVTDVELQEVDATGWNSLAGLDPDDTDMPSDLKPEAHRPASHLHQPLLAGDKQNGYASPSRSRNASATRQSSSRFRERANEMTTKDDTRTRYTYAAIFLFISLITFAVQTETAVYIQHTLKWNKAYCML